MKVNKWLIGMAVLVIMALGVACSQGKEAPTSTPSTATTAGTGSSAPASSIISAEGYAGGAPGAFGRVTPLSLGNVQAGIWVSGQGSVTLKPDLALLNLGVEARASTVAEARQRAAAAMNGIIEALRTHRVADRDIQTRSFNITPQYDYRNNRQVLLGYIVSNTLRVKIRDLDSLGAIIDDAAQAGGDLTRINGISFTVEDPAPYMSQARELAVKDALAKAKQFASLTGVQLGSLVYISESGGMPVVPAPVPRMALEAGTASTPISGGELEVQVAVQATFSIAGPQ